MNSFADVELYLDSLINYESVTPLGSGRDAPKLEPVRAAVRALDLPVRLPNCVHIAGTVGKGSTAAFAQTLLSVKHRTLSFTSPHLVSVRERVQLDGENLADEMWCEGMSVLRDAHAAGLIPKLTYFETVWIFYLWCAKKLGTAAHVVETGLGGSFDATNVLEETIAILTRIHFDHTHILGDTLEKIARDKSGIIKSGGRAISVTQEEEALRPIEQAASNAGIPLTLEMRNFDCTILGERLFHYASGARVVSHLAIPLSGEFQRHNLGAALAAVLPLQPGWIDEDIRTALSRVRLQARLQTLSQFHNLLLDVCHNPASFEELATYLRKAPKFSKRVALVAMMKDKDAQASLIALAGAVDELWITDAPTPRCADPNTLLEIARKIGYLAHTMEREAAYEKLKKLPATTQGIVCGSFYLVGDFLKQMQDARTA